MYSTPDGWHAIVVEEARQTLAFRNPHTFALQKALPVECAGVDRKQREAMSEHINYSGSLARALGTTVAMYIIMNGKYANRGPVFACEPGEASYTPLWQEVFVSWTAPSKAVPLGRDDQINDLAKKGVLTLKMTKTVLNCPIIKVMSGSTSGSHSGSGY